MRCQATLTGPKPPLDSTVSASPTVPGQKGGQTSTAPPIPRQNQQPPSYSTTVIRTHNRPQKRYRGTRLVSAGWSKEEAGRTQRCHQRCKRRHLASRSYQGQTPEMQREIRASWGRSKSARSRTAHRQYVPSQTAGSCVTYVSIVVSTTAATDTASKSVTLF